MSLVDPTLAEVLVCTIDKADLTEDLEAQEFECTKCGRRYPVRDGMAMMRVDEAEEAKSE